MKKKGLLSLFHRLPAVLGRGMLFVCLVLATLSGAIAAEEKTQPLEATHGPIPANLADESRMPAIAALTLVALTFVVWALALRRQVALRTRNLEQEIAERKRAEENAAQVRYFEF